jgi:hypothetical protein
MALSKFEKEFKAARDRGEKEFDFGGKKYNTKYKEEAETSVKPSRKPSPMPMPMPREAGIAEANSMTSPMPAAPTGKKEYYRNLSGKMVEKTPTKTTEEDSESGLLGKRMRAALGSSYKKGGSVSSASKRADGIAQKGKTRGKMC